MQINELNPHPNARKKGKRLGRGIGSGKGKTSGKGHKGQWARSGGGVRPGFEGGQMPLIRRLPKRGFTNNFAKEYSIVNVGDLGQFKKGTEITAEFLLDFGMLSKIEPYGLKVLGDGELTIALTVVASKFTKSAKQKIEKAGGKCVEVIKTPKVVEKPEEKKPAPAKAPVKAVAQKPAATKAAVKTATPKTVPAAKKPDEKKAPAKK